ncbi:Lrp/AsnC family transcriptional regulator [Candidatus Woesearchaeota archaeon]|nr:Lrp/AsnC family transcriptional regulator [Candidatus Woesearchaeota archaeon]
MSLDNLDKRIIYELDLNARATVSEIAKKVRKSKETVNFRLNRLLDHQVIKGFVTIINTQKMGWFYQKVYLKFRNITREKEAEFYNYILKQRNISYLAETEGYYDCFLLVLVNDPQKMALFLDNFMQKYGEFVRHKDIVTFLSVHRFNQRYLYKGGETVDRMNNMPLSNYQLDETDNKLLSLIANHARISLVELSKQLLIDPKAVKYHLNKLEKEKIILGYALLTDFKLLGLQFFQINISLKDSSQRYKLIEFFNSTYKCLFAIELLGKYDLLVELHVKDNEELQSIINSFRDQFCDVYNDYDIHTVNREYAMSWGSYFLK